MEDAILAKIQNNAAPLDYEAKLWAAADALRGFGAENFTEDKVSSQHEWC